MIERVLAAALALCAATACPAAPLTIALLQRADDPRFVPALLELAYPGHAGGSLQAAVKMAIDETKFELDAAHLDAKLELREATDAADAAAKLQGLARAGAAGVVLDLPAAWLAPAAAASAKAAPGLALVNAGDADETLRKLCLAPLFHTLPGERMRADALAQTLLARRWQRVLLLRGPGEDDVARAAIAQAAVQRYGLKLAATKAFKLSADPRERNLSNPALLTGPDAGEYDVVWVVDGDGEFARGLPYRVALPRPVVGDAGLFADAWSAHFDRYGAPQLSHRFARAANRPMTGADWAAYAATKALLAGALAHPAAVDAASVSKTLAQADFTFDGAKGVRLGFRAWDHQLRQPLLLTDGEGVIGLAPVDGVMHAKNVLDTLGADAPESNCRR